MECVLKSVLFAVTVFIGAAPTIAQAVTLEEYLECVARGGNLINCAYNVNSSLISFKVPDDFAPTEKDIHRAGEMVKSGVFSKYAEHFGSKERITKGAVQICKSSRLLNMLEKEMPPEKIDKECFE